MPPSELENALNLTVAAASLPPELPLAHLTVARYLLRVLNAGALAPRTCKVFKKKLLYFSYGGVFYRTLNMQTENASELPVAMVFSPVILDICEKLFPFDSGAMDQRLYGDTWYEQMRPFDQRFSVTAGDLSKAARSLVHNLYKTNAKYIEGRPVKALDSPSPTLELLHQFLDEDQSGGSIDHRQRSIEALSVVSAKLADQLIWIGLPHARVSKAVKAIKKHTRTLPQIYPYHCNRNFNPDAVAADLERAAREEVFLRYLE